VRRNRLVLGDNEVVLRRLARSSTGRFRLAYLDPPFNTGRRFGEYDDRQSPEEWAGRMRRAAQLVLPLLAEDGAIALEIDDTELGSLIGTMDEVMGRAQRMSVITVVRSAATGHKARNRGPVNVADYLLIYAKDRARFRPNPLFRPRDDVDPAYSTFLHDPEAPLGRWRFSPLRLEVSLRLGCASARAARAALGRDAFEREVDRFALAHGAHVVRFAQPRYEAISKAARRLVDRSRARPGVVLKLEREGHRPLLVVNGNRILFLEDKLAKVDGETRVVEPLTNVWTDIGFQGIAREGGVRFIRNKKPERLLQRILSMLTDAGDWVLDPFAGSGTTAAVAEKMGRRWVAIERERAVWALAKERLARVARGEDRTGISGAD